MLVQALAQYAYSNLSEELKDEAWEEKPVPYLIELASDGSFLGVVERKTTNAGSQKPVGQNLTVPRSPVNRNTGLHPLLGADDIKYVLGAGAWTNHKEKENHQERHEAFVKFLDEAARQTHDPSLAACAHFYARADQVEKARETLKHANSGSMVALSVKGPVMSRPVVQDYWRKHYANESQAYVEAKGGFGECLISGTVGPIAATHKKIKGLGKLGGRAEVSLMSFDKDSFCSYGWSQNQNSPVSPQAAMAYVLALNDLLKPGNGHRKDIAGVGFIFWLKRKEDFSVFDILDQPAEEQVKALLEFKGGDPEPNAFYMAGVSGNGGRLRVRYWITDALPNIKRNLGEWFQQLRVSGFGDSPSPVSFWQLRQVIHRTGEPPAHQVIALMRRAIEGRRHPLGHEMLAAALEPLRHSGEPSSTRLGLVRLCINDLIHVHKTGDTEMTEEIDPGQMNPAYLCGRLFAEYEGLQYEAQGEVNASVKDRYYALASTSPEVAFPKIGDLGNKHLRKLRRDKRGAAVSIEQRIQELHVLLEQVSRYKFPPMLDLEDQGRFALGYHHQRAHSRAQARARKEERQRQENNEEES